MLVTTRAAGPRSFLTSPRRRPVAFSAGASGVIGAGDSPPCCPSATVLGWLRCRGAAAALAAGWPRTAAACPAPWRRVQRPGGGGRLRRAPRRAGRRRAGPRARRRLRRPRGPRPFVRRRGPRARAGRAVAAVGARRRRACSPRRSPTTRGRPRSCPAGTARTARPRATRWRRRPPGDRCWRAGQARRIRLFHRVEDGGQDRGPQPIPARWRPRPGCRIVSCGAATSRRDAPSARTRSRRAPRRRRSGPGRHPTTGGGSRPGRR